MEKILQVKKLEKVYGNQGIIGKALNGVDFSVEEGEFIGIMGASGSGKSTLLNCISTLESPTSGEILLEGKNLEELKDKDAFRGESLGLIFQEFDLITSLTGMENILLALDIGKIKGENLKEKARDMAEAMDIKEILEKYPEEMSGGQKQRLVCLRAMIKEPKLILADEPTGALDTKSARKVMEILTEISGEKGTVLMATHDSNTASYASRVIFIKDGRIFSDIEKGKDTRSDFFQQILQITSVLGGEIYVD